MPSIRRVTACVRTTALEPLMTQTIAGAEALPPARSLTAILALACGLIVANIYYAQPLAGPIGAALGLPPQATGLVVTFTQIGYGLGLLFIVPLGDLLENRRLVLTLLGLTTLALIGAGLSTAPSQFFAAALLIGVASVAVQVLVPYAAHLAPEAERGRVVGEVMSGLMLGIMLSRPISSFIAEMAGWPVVFESAAAAMLLLMVLLRRTLPPHRPAAGLHYGQLLASMGRLLLTTPVLRRRALYHAGLFSAFSLFWTTVPLLLAGPEYRLSQGGIALFALFGVSGAIAAPIAGRIADRGWTRPATALAIFAVAASFLLAHLSAHGSSVGLVLLGLAAILLDFGLSANMTLGQRAIFSLGAAYRGRLNGLYMAIFFVGGALGSALGGWAFAHGGWALASWLGMALPTAALIYFATEQ
jgi:predicted MFS family arabinose efflux permease